MLQELEEHLQDFFRPVLNVLLSRHLTDLFPTSIHMIIHQLKFNVGISN